MRKVKVVQSRYINTEPAFVFGKNPVLVMSFGAEEGPVIEKAFSIIEGREMIVDLLQSLATLGDPLAQEIGEKYFSKKD
jgi:hypothetical protein